MRFVPYAEPCLLSAHNLGWLVRWVNAPDLYAVPLPSLPPRFPSLPLQRFLPALPAAPCLAL